MTAHEGQLALLQGTPIKGTLPLPDEVVQEAVHDWLVDNDCRLSITAVRSGNTKRWQVICKPNSDYYPYGAATRKHLLDAQVDAIADWKKCKANDGKNM